MFIYFNIYLISWILAQLAQSNLILFLISSKNDTVRLGHEPGTRIQIYIKTVTPGVVARLRSLRNLGSRPKLLCSPALTSDGAHGPLPRFHLAFCLHTVLAQLPLARGLTSFAVERTRVLSLRVGRDAFGSPPSAARALSLRSSMVN